MILIGMFDSPFVRRVAVSMRLLEIPFAHRNWSVGKDQSEIRRYNPLGRVPTLVLDDGETLVESSAILDYLDDRVGPARALLPPTGADRRLARLPAAPPKKAWRNSTRACSARKKSATSPGSSAVARRWMTRSPNSSATPRR
jgi:hypothetical protein